MLDSTLLSEAKKLILASRRIMVTTHVKPDGDAAGSMGGLVDALRSLGKDVAPLFLSAVPRWYEFLVRPETQVVGRDLLIEDLLPSGTRDIDLFIILDANSRNQLPDIGAFASQSEKPVLVVDHHATSDGLGSLELVDTGAAATGLLIYELLTASGWQITERMAEALFVAIATDTGWFQFGNADSRVYRAAGALIEAGARPADIYEALYQNFSYARFLLTQAMLSTLELHFDGQFAYQHIRRVDFERTETEQADTENLINECHRIGSIRASVLLVELEDGRIRCSLRSRGSVDVSQIARAFGGGGHKMASGTFLDGPLENAKQAIIDGFRPHFE